MEKITMSLERLDHFARGMLFDFADWLTSIKGKICFSCSHITEPAKEVVDQFLRIRGVQSCEPMIQWVSRCGPKVDSSESTLQLEKKCPKCPFCGAILHYGMEILLKEKDQNRKIMILINF